MRNQHSKRTERATISVCRHEIKTWNWHRRIWGFPQSVCVACVAHSSGTARRVRSMAQTAAKVTLFLPHENFELCFESFKLVVVWGCRHFWIPCLLIIFVWPAQYFGCLKFMFRGTEVVIHLEGQLYRGLWRPLCKDSASSWKRSLCKDIVSPLSSFKAHFCIQILRVLVKALVERSSELFQASLYTDRYFPRATPLHCMWPPCWRTCLQESAKVLQVRGKPW